MTNTFDKAVLLSHVRLCDPSGKGALQSVNREETPAVYHSPAPCRLVDT
jgi:hypothetical protein